MSCLSLLIDVTIVNDDFEKAKRGRVRLDKYLKNKD